MNEPKQKYNKILLQWEGGGKNKDPNTLLWTILILAIVAGAMIYYFVMKEWVTSMVFVFMLIVLIWYLAVSPKKVRVAIADKGILLNEQFYDFQGIKGYWFSPKSEIMYLAPQGQFSMVLAVPIEGQNVNRIKSLLPEHVLEVEGRGEDLVDKVSRILHL